MRIEENAESHFISDFAMLKLRRLHEDIPAEASKELGTFYETEAIRFEALDSPAVSPVKDRIVVLQLALVNLILPCW